MVTANGIIKELPDSPALNFNALRKEGLRLIQELSGRIWTDYNSHDPGVTTLEILCYAITELGYRTSLLKDAFEAEDEVSDEMIGRYFFKPEDVLPPLPLTNADFEDFIIQHHSKVRMAWVNGIPLIHPSGSVKGGYDVALLLKRDSQYGNLNTDTLRIDMEQGDTVIEVVLLDDENHRIPWKDMDNITACVWNKQDPEAFFVFEQYNCQVSLLIDALHKGSARRRQFPVKARIAVQSRDNPPEERFAPALLQDAIIQKLEDPKFLSILDDALEKEHYKARIAKEVQRSLLSCRNLCEEFVAFRIVNEQEVKIEAELVLTADASPAAVMMARVWDQLDLFLAQLLQKTRTGALRSGQPVLYASHLIAAIKQIGGVVSVKINSLNVFVDGVPTVSLRNEVDFDCIRLQPFAAYVPVISRGKSHLNFVRSDNNDTPDLGAPTRPLPDQTSHTSPATETQPVTVKERTRILHPHFFEELRNYYSIQHEFPSTYRLPVTELPAGAPEMWQQRTRQFRTYLAFFERILIDYLERLGSFNALLSVKQDSVMPRSELALLKDKLAGIEWLADPDATEPGDHVALSQKNNILDHLLARFATNNIPIGDEETDGGLSERMIAAKTRLLRDVPLITRERGLGIVLNSGNPEKAVWENHELSGFQKRLYRLLGIENDHFLHRQLSKIAGTDPMGFYLVEHLLLFPRGEDTARTKAFNRAAGLIGDYLLGLSGQRGGEDRYSFQLSVVIPDWYQPWSDRRPMLAEVIRNELPAHIYPYIHWLDKARMKEFEKYYNDWLKSLSRLYAT